MTTPDNPTVREMRQQIRLAARGYERVDGKTVSSRSIIAPAAHMIRAVLALAESEGWSGEDAMTMLAYHALKGYEGLYDRVLEHAMLEPSPSFIMPAKP